MGNKVDGNVIAKQLEVQYIVINSDAMIVKDIRPLFEHSLTADILESSEHGHLICMTSGKGQHCVWVCLFSKQLKEQALLNIAYIY